MGVHVKFQRAPSLRHRVLQRLVRQDCALLSHWEGKGRQEALLLYLQPAPDRLQSLESRTVSRITIITLECSLTTQSDGRGAQDTCPQSRHPRARQAATQGARLVAQRDYGAGGRLGQHAAQPGPREAAQARGGQPAAQVVHLEHQRDQALAAGAAAGEARPQRRDGEPGRDQLQGVRRFLAQDSSF